MNELIDFLNSHGSVRHFTGEPITEEQERIIVSSAERSPTSSNLHAYSILSVHDQATKDAIAEISGNQAHVSKSALFLMFCADLYRLATLNGKRGYPFNGEYTEMFIVATVDAALAGSRALLAAQALGLGGVMVGAIRNNPAEIASLLKLPELVYPVMGMSLGHPTKPPVPKPRLPLEGLWFKERYDTSALEGAVAEYDRIIEEHGHLKGREIDPENYPDFTGTYTWSEHSARRMANCSPTALRPHLKSFLQKRGFLKD